MSSLRKVAFDNGYAVSIKTSFKTKTWIVCSRSGEYRNNNTDKETRKYRSGSSKINCPFMLIAELVDDCWILNVINQSHSHSNDMEDRTCGRQRLTASQITSVVHSTAAGITPKQIIASMKAENPDIHANTKAIYNLKTRIRAAYLDGRTSVQALLDFLAEKNYLFEYKTENGNLLTVLSLSPFRQAGQTVSVDVLARLYI